MSPAASGLAVGNERVAVLAIHGIGNQREGETAALVRDAIASAVPPEQLDDIHVSEFWWAKHGAHPSGATFLLWLARALPMLVFLSLDQDIRDEPTYKATRNSRAAASILLVIAALTALFMVYFGQGLEAVLLLPFASAWLFVIRTANLRRLIARVGIIAFLALSVLTISGPLPAIATMWAIATSMIIFPRKNFLSSITLPATSTIQFDAIARSLSSRVDNLQRSHDRVVIVCHSMGAYLTARALTETPHQSITERTPVTVISYGSAIRTLPLLLAHARDRALRLRVWLYCFALTFAAIGCMILLANAAIILVFPSIKLSTTIDAWLGGAPGSWPRLLKTYLPILAPYADSPYLHPFRFAFTDGMILTFAGALVSIWTAGEIRQRCSSLPLSLVRAATSWIDCSSVHDSVGRITMPTAPGVQSIWLGGIGLPLVDHSFKRYLAKGSFGNEILAEMLKWTNPRPMTFLKARLLIEIENFIDRQRDALVITSIIFLTFYWGLTEPGSLVPFLKNSTVQMYGTICICLLAGSVLHHGLRAVYQRRLRRDSIVNVGHDVLRRRTSTSVGSERRRLHRRLAGWALVLIPTLFVAAGFDYWVFSAVWDDHVKLAVNNTSVWTILLDCSLICGPLGLLLLMILIVQLYFDIVTSRALILMVGCLGISAAIADFLGLSFIYGFTITKDVAAGILTIALALTMTLYGRSAMSIANMNDAVIAQRGRLLQYDSNPLQQLPLLRSELLRRARIIEATNARTSSAAKMGASVGTEGLAWLKSIVDDLGWPGRSMVGEDGAHAAALLAESADYDPKLQKRCLELLADAVALGEAAPGDLARLTDRILLNDGQDQLYGTQLLFENERWMPPRLHEPMRVDERRAAMSLEPLADQIAHLEHTDGDGQPRASRDA